MASLILVLVTTTEEYAMYQFTIDNMTCQGCAAAVTRAISAIDKTAQVKAFPAIRRLQVETSIPSEQLLALLDDAGYTAQPEE